MAALPGVLPVWRRIPGAVWALGFTSLFMDMASEAIHSLLPIFLVYTLGASTSVLGLLEGVAEGLTAITKLGSGLLSDRWRARKSLTIVGYALGGLSKPLFALAPGVGLVVIARLSDRFGKGIRGAPRDALIADLTPREIQGAAFGLRQALDTVGAILGLLGAIALMAWFGFSVRAVFWAATIPAALAVLVLWLGVKEPRREASTAKEPAWRWRDATTLPVAFWAVVAVGGALTMARFSEAFLVLRAQDQGLAIVLVPLVLVLMNVVYAAVSYPAGALADRIAPFWLLAAGSAALAAADALLMVDGGLAFAMAGIALWGLHMGLTQGVMSAMIALVAPAAFRGTAFGLFNLVMGVVMIVSSATAGVLWERFGAAATFVAGGIFSLVALLGAVALAPHLKRG